MYHHGGRQVLQHHTRDAPVEVAHLVRGGFVQLLRHELHLLGVVEAAVAGEQLDHTGSLEVLLLQGVLVQFGEFRLRLQDLQKKDKPIRW